MGQQLLSKLTNEQNIKSRDQTTCKIHKTRSEKDAEAIPETDPTNKNFPNTVNIKLTDTLQNRIDELAAQVS